MKKISLIVAITFATFTFYKCAAPAALTSPADKELAIAKKRWPDATKESLAQGHSIYTVQCMKCHGDKGITSRSEAEWTKVLGYMAPKANLTAAETEIVQRYIYTARELSLAK